ncbi:unnamed protein product [Staurois parvus]|uniref:Uncharacterized protein n=1 Tax=Staurois parvus TaxID=386267 RepID=A0ABN9BNQ1_9NEOB|nr:unnamed protein product [Staurois parvus]
MTRDCGQNRDDQRLRTEQGGPETADSTGMTRDCGQHRDDQRLRTAQG